MYLSMPCRVYIMFVRVNDPQLSISSLSKGTRTSHVAINDWAGHCNVIGTKRSPRLPNRATHFGFSQAVFTSSKYPVTDSYFAQVEYPRSFICYAAFNIKLSKELVNLSLSSRPPFKTFRQAKVANCLKWHETIFGLQR